jgi:hypothetical protein
LQSYLAEAAVAWVQDQIYHLSQDTAGLNLTGENAQLAAQCFLFLKCEMVKIESLYAETSKTG